jgi:hypothetical protein
MSRSTKEVNLPSVAPVGVFRIRALDFFLVVTFERRVAEGGRVDIVVTGKGLGSRESKDL